MATKFHKMMCLPVAGQSGLAQHLDPAGFPPIMKTVLAKYQLSTAMVGTMVYFHLVEPGKWLGIDWFVRCKRFGHNSRDGNTDSLRDAMSTAIINSLVTPSENLHLLST